jgi:hypothetical protein
MPRRHSPPSQHFLDCIVQEWIACMIFSLVLIFNDSEASMETTWFAHAKSFPVGWQLHQEVATYTKLWFSLLLLLCPHNHDEQVYITFLKMQNPPSPSLPLSFSQEHTSYLPSGRLPQHNLLPWTCCQCWMFYLSCKTPEQQQQNCIVMSHLLPSLI